MLKIKQLILSLILLLSTMSLSSVSMAKDIFTQQGKASWYGGKHHGKKTASGVAYNMHSLTAAHKTLPFNSKVKVTDMNSGKSVILTITDRGPYSGNRILDLSYAAAKDLDIINKGVAKVKLELLN